MGRPLTSIGQRREVSILLPVALLVMALVSTFALLAYRNTLELLVEERVVEAERLGRQLSGELTLGRLREVDRLRYRVPQVSGLSVFDDKGRLIAGEGASDLVSGLGDGGILGRLLGTGGPRTVSGTTRFKADGKAYTLRVDLPSQILRSRQQGVRVLTPLVLVVNGAITLIVLLFLRRFLLPFDRMVERARRAGREVGASQDEVGFLVETFEKALEALTETSKGDATESLEGTLVRSLESGVLLCDAAGTVLGLNDIGARLLDVPVPSMGVSLHDVLASRPTLLEILDRAVRLGEAVQREECTIRAGANERTLGITVHALRREDSEIRGFLSVFADLTEVQEKQREKWLADSLSQLGELTAGAAHELRNSLATLRGYLSLIERDPGSEMRSEYLAEIRHESDHLKRVLEDFLTFARPGSLRPQEVDLLSLVHRAAADPGLDGAAVEVHLDPSAAGDAGGLVMQGDPQLLERAVRNLLSNAVDAQQEVECSEPVQMQLALQSTGVELTIADRGTGLPEEDRERIFDPFYSRRSGGVGMGLALTRRIALLHQGRIELVDREEGGTRAVLWLPLGKSVTESSI